MLRDQLPNILTTASVNRAHGLHRNLHAPMRPMLNPEQNWAQSQIDFESVVLLRADCLSTLSRTKAFESAQMNQKLGSVWLGLIAASPSTKTERKSLACPFMFVRFIVLCRTLQE